MADLAAKEEVQWEQLFNEETPAHIRQSIAVMEEEIFGEFKVRLGEGVVMSHYWRLKFILSRSMDERESYTELIRITVGKFQEEAESNLKHMRSLLRLSGSPFQRVSRGEDVAMAESVDVYVTSECILLCILYYCNPMFIPGYFYYVFESCGHAPMFRSGGL